MIVGYCRPGVVLPAKSLAAQKRELAVVGAEEIFCERLPIFGSTSGLERAIEFVQKGDVIVITRPYHVALSTRGVLALIDRLGRKGVGLRILNTPVNTSTTTGRMVLASTPLWSLGISPVLSLLRDLTFGLWAKR